jgi:tripartite-type tricarboxylate transporter receptor subunit TctC
MPGNEEVPLVADFKPDVVAQTWFGLLVPARSPDGMIERISQAAVQVIRGDDFRGRMLNEGMFAAGSTPAEFGHFLTRESDRWGPLLRRLELQAG